MERPFPDLVSVLKVIDRLDSLADTAELMGDPDGAARLRAQASSRRLAAMESLDD
ncbi:hypothetical protein BH23ACT3_BH23ACT3_03570 [soil metagenome]